MAAKRKTPVKTRNPDLIRGVGKYSRSNKPLLNKRKPKPTKLRIQRKSFQSFLSFYSFFNHTLDLRWNLRCLPGHRHWRRLLGLVTMGVGFRQRVVITKA
ncbi:uncharacterized protein LOC128031896 [Gossypium raimondii]|uniref:uncharacterized protein LOC128031896 n=1 Tax=Gossypium raimondii TaxID=29730 RepID=UPI00227A6131|nr:uncharacterized protein LOC128031896 [Gossypium raimondii]